VAAFPFHTDSYLGRVKCSGCFSVSHRLISWQSEMQWLLFRFTPTHILAKLNAVAAFRFHTDGGKKQLCEQNKCSTHHLEKACLSGTDYHDAPPPQNKIRNTWRSGGLARGLVPDEGYINTAVSGA